MFHVIANRKLRQRHHAKIGKPRVPNSDQYIPLVQSDREVRPNNRSRLSNSSAAQPTAVTTHIDSNNTINPLKSHRFTPPFYISQTFNRRNQSPQMQTDGPR